MTSQAEYLDVAGVRTCCHLAGTGAPVFLLHGLGASSYSWRKLMPALCARYRVVAPDWPGHGRSDQPRDFDYSLKGLARWLLALMEKVGTPQASLVGNSLGGASALMAALEFPGAVSRLALIGTPTYIENRPKILWPMRWPVIGKVYEWSLGPRLVEAIARRTFVDQSVVTRELVSEYSLALSTAAGRRAVAQIIRSAVPENPGAYQRRYKDLPHPTLVMVGEKDGMVDPAAARRFSREVPKASFVAIPDAGHAPQEEKPGPVAEALVRFLS